MTSLPRLFGSAVLSVSLAAAALAQAPTLDVKMGLWEITSVTEIGGQMPTMDMSKMTPDQKAKIEEAMKSMMGSHTDVSKTCMTKEKLDKADFMMGDDPNMACKKTMTVNTRTVLDMTVACTGEHAATGQIHLETASPAAFTGAMKSSNTDQGRTMTMTMKMTGKWLAANCGTVD